MGDSVTFKPIKKVEEERSDENVAKLLLKRFSPTVSSALMGHIDVETGGTYKHDTNQVGGEGYGLIQFSGGMKKGYQDYIENTDKQDSNESQIDFIDDVLKSGDNYDIGAGNRQKIQDASKRDDLSEITDILQNRFIKPGKPHTERRKESSESWMEKIGNFMDTEAGASEIPFKPVRKAEETIEPFMPEKKVVTDFAPKQLTATDSDAFKGAKNPFALEETLGDVGTKLGEEDERIKYNVRDPRHPDYDEKQKAWETLSGINAVVKGAFPLLWGEALISGPGVAIQERKSGKEILQAIPDNLKDYAGSIIQDLKVAGGKNIPPEDLKYAQGFSDIWANYYETVTGEKAPVWYSMASGTASLIGLSVISPEFKILAKKTAKSMGQEGEDLVSAIKTHNKMVKVLKGEKKEFIKMASKRGISPKEADKMANTLIKEVSKPQSISGKIDTGLERTFIKPAKEPYAFVRGVGKKTGIKTPTPEIKPVIKPAVKPVVKPTAKVPIKPITPFVPKIKVSEQPMSLEDKKTYMNEIRTDISEGEAGKRYKTDAGEWGSIPSSFPEYFKGRGLTKKFALNAIDKFMENKQLTEKQQEFISNMEDTVIEKRNRDVEYEREEAKSEVAQLAQEALKYKTAEEWLGFMRGSATQYRDYNPQLRAKYKIFEDSARISELGIDPEKEITIYRGVSDARTQKIVDGDFVTVDRLSAESYAGKEYVVSKKVKAKDLIADSASEFDKNRPFGLGAEFIYSDSKNKLSFLSDSQLTDTYNKAHEVKVKGASAGSSVAAVSSETPKGYGTVEANERPVKEHPPKTDYSKVDEELPDEKFSVIDEALRIIAPAARKKAELGATILRKNISQLAYKDVVVQETLKKAHRAFTWMSKDDVYKFMDNMENGKPQQTENTQKISDVFRKLLDSRKDAVQSLGKGHLESFYENYFPHIWEDPKKAKNVISTILGRKRLEGSKSFLKQRKIMTIKDGVERGLKLVSENPVDLVSLKIHEMDRYIMAQNIIRDLKEKELLKFTYSRSKTPDGYLRINDSAFTIFMPPEITKKEAYDVILVDQLLDISNSLGINTKRLVSIGGRALGKAFGEYGKTGNERVRTKYASPESVLAHEIGHVLGYRYKLYDLLRRTNDGEYREITRGKNKGREKWTPTKEAVEHRQKIDKQWRKLADMRYERLSHVKPDSGFAKYVRKAREKEAVMLEALIHAPDKFKKTAPDLYKMFRAFLNNNAELRPLLDIKPSLVLGESDAKIKIPGFTTLGYWTAPEPVATLLNNHLSPGLRSADNKIISNSYNLLRGTGNILNQVQLALSGFHALNVTTDMTASTFGLGLRKLMTKGQLLSGLKDIVLSPVAAIPSVWSGSRIKKAYRKGLENITDPKLRTMVEAVINSGGRDRMDTMYYNQQIKGLEKTFSNIVKGSPLEKAKGILQFPLNLTGSILETLAKPLMAWYVPTGKVGLFSKLAEHELKRAEAGELTEDQLAVRLMSSWDSVDNRMGQLVYDNLFWNKILKDAAMLAVRSVGWNLGSWREYAGAGVDLLNTKGRIEGGDKFLSHKMAYTIGAIVTYMVLGATITKILTGKYPEELKDYFFPRTGNINPDGSEERLSLPTYAKDWYAYGTQPLKTTTHKIHPQWGLLGDLLSNKDFFDVEIRHEGDPLLDQMNSQIQHIRKTARPISFMSYERLKKTSPDDKWRNLWISISGITPAPSYISRSTAQKLMTRYIIDRIPRGTRTKESFEKSTYRKILINRMRKGEPIDKDEAMLVLGQRGAKLAATEALKMPFAASYNRLAIREAINVFAVATKKERDESINIFIKKLNKYDERLSKDEKVFVKTMLDEYRGTK